MGFISLVIIMPWLLCSILVLIALEWLGVAVLVLAKIMLLGNALVFLFLVLLRRWLFARGYLGDDFISTFSDWRRTALRAARLALTLLIFWEALVVFGCLAVLIWQPDFAGLLGSLIGKP